MFRALLTLLGIVAVVGLVGYIAKPEWFANILNTKSEQPVAVTNVTISATLSKSGSGGKSYQMRAKSEASSKTLESLIEEEGDGVPPRNNPYLLIINKSSDQMRYLKFARGVQKLTLRNAPSELRFQETGGAQKAGPYQATLWLDREYLQIDLEIEAEVPAGSK